MRVAVLKTGFVAVAALVAAFSLYPQSPASNPSPTPEPQGIPPRATPGDYQAHAPLGALTIAAEFVGHYVPTPEGTLTQEDYVAVEVAVFGQPDSRLVLSTANFSLRVNGRKSPIPAESYSLIVRGLKDPDWEMTVAKPKSKDEGGDEGGGASVQAGPKPTPTPIKYPIEVQRGMARRAQKVSLAEGDRPLPQAGLTFFPYRGKPSDIRLLELIYSGPAGKATLQLHAYGG
jgi:hypothetical protein